MELRADVLMDAPAAAAWAVLGERFGDIGEWAAPITASTLDSELGTGSVRTCHVAGFGPVAPGVIRERLIEFEPEHRSRATVQLRGPIRLVPPLFRWQMQVNAARVMDELRYRVEHGRPHQRKLTAPKVAHAV